MNDQQTALIKSLLTRTEDGKVDWNRTAEEVVYQAVVGAYVISVRRGGGEFDRESYGRIRQMVVGRSWGWQTSSAAC